MPVAKPERTTKIVVLKSLLRLSPAFPLISRRKIAGIKSVVVSIVSRSSGPAGATFLIKPKTANEVPSVDEVQGKDPKD